MNYTGPATSFDDVIQHLRNKNLAVFPSSRGRLVKLAERLQRKVSRLHWKAVRSAGWQVIVSEQVVEGPLVLRHIRETDRRVLDFGGYESILPLQLSALGHRVTVLDQRRYPFSHPNLTVETVDLYDPALQFPEPFDTVVSVSTIEHLGLGGYGDVTHAQGDAAGVQRLWSFLRPGGRLLASVPAGRPAVQRGYRVYDEARIRSVFPSISAIHWFKKDHRLGGWSPSSAAAVKDTVYGEPTGRLPVEAVAFVVCEKS
jgi:2-polyprenyl-3-methyl-5-hydroxy-6-metoxy-1,4-benzoquinol methylase